MNASLGLSAAETEFLLSLNLSDPKDRETYSKWLTDRDRKCRLRTAAAHEERGELRCGIAFVSDIHTQEDDMTILKTPQRSVRERLAHRLQGFGTIVTDTPDPYARPHPRALSDPSDDPAYDPFGSAPDGYALAIERKTRTGVRHDA